MADFSKYVNDAFSALTPDIDFIFEDAKTYALSDWKAKQCALVTASGAASVAIPGLHLIGIPADVAFLMNRMSVSSFGIGTIIAQQKGLGNILEAEDFPIILGRWCGDENLSNAAISKAAAEAAAKTGNKILAKELAKIASKRFGIVIGQKLGGKLGAKLGGKFGAKLGTRIALGFIPVLGAAVSGGINLYFINEINEHAESWYAYKSSM